MKRFLPLFTLYAFYSILGFGQKITEHIKFQTEIGAYLSTSGQNPFWLRSNQYGIVPLESQFITLRGSANKEYDSTQTKNNKISKFGYGYGASTTINAGKINQIYLPEAYLKVRYGAFEFYGGRRKEIVGLVDTALTSGSYIWSGNALPMPKIQISIPNYTSIIGEGLISIKGSYAHGWFGNQGHTKKFFLHQKTLYGRIGKPNWKVKFYGGFNHQVQWGGKSKAKLPQTSTFDGTFPSSFKDYIFVVTGQSIGYLKDKKDMYAYNDSVNRIGNHLGTIDIGCEFYINKNTRLSIYRQNIYEDGSLFYLANIEDGLTGISILMKKNRYINSFAFEFLNTKDQGSGGGPSNPTDKDNYFNNSQYIDGWTYRKIVIGSPMMTPLFQIKNDLISNEDTKKVPDSFIANNRFQIINASLTSTVAKIDVYIKWSHSSNYGSFATPLVNTLTQDSFVLSLSQNRNSIIYTIGFAGDIGKLFNNCLSFHFNILKKW